jgi:hypothetical protein
MDYELLRQLHDARYPLKPYPEWAAAKDGPMAPEFISPTLSELKEALGDKLKSLVENHTAQWRWWASAYSDGAIVCGGKTPEEALARLWLQLNLQV